METDFYHGFGLEIAASIPNEFVRPMPCARLHIKIQFKNLNAVQGSRNMPHLVAPTAHSFLIFKWLGF
jgi:hypothetical protein